MRSQAGKKAWQTRQRNLREDRKLQRRLAGVSAYQTMQANGLSVFDPDRHTLLDFVRQAGGIKETIWRGEAAQFSIRECGLPLLNGKTGRCFETLLQMSIEEGFFPPDTEDVNEFIDTLERDVFAKKFGGSQIFSVRRQDFDFPEEEEADETANIV